MLFRVVRPRPKERAAVCGSPSIKFAKTLVLEYGISRTKSYQLVKDYLCGRGEAANSDMEMEGDARV